MTQRGRSWRARAAVIRLVRSGARWAIGIVAGVAAAVAVVLWHGRPGSATSRPCRGRGSCSATACHGGMRPGRRARCSANEHTTWVTRDRHADAYQVLTERAVAGDRRATSGRPAARRQGRTLPRLPRDPGRRARLGGARPLWSATASAASRATAPPGAGSASTRAADWPAQTPEDKAAVRDDADRPTWSAGREVCAGCHVGAPARDGLPARDVNHDLIAAGHPRLNFEFSAYLANMPHHWRDDVDRDAAADFPARAWAVGQVVTARAALDLLRRPRPPRRGRRRQRPVAPGPSSPSTAASPATTTCATTPGGDSPAASRRRPGRAAGGPGISRCSTTLADAGPDADGEALAADSTPSGG